jgi:hypothetical protein
METFATLLRMDIAQLPCEPVSLGVHVRERALSAMLGPMLGHGYGYLIYRRSGCQRLGMMDERKSLFTGALRQE